MTDQVDELTNAVLAASRAVVSVELRSIASVDASVTLPQFRALVVLDQFGGHCRVGDLAAELRIEPSTATRLCDRLVRRGLVQRHENETNRREVAVTLSAGGKRLVDKVTEVRRVEIGAIVSRIPPSNSRNIVEGLKAFRGAAGPDLAPPTVSW
jgi:DNA-binding MarR family transcriptional regulator